MTNGHRTWLVYFSCLHANRKKYCAIGIKLVSKENGGIRQVGRHAGCNLLITLMQFAVLRPIRIESKSLLPTWYSTLRAAALAVADSMAQESPETVIFQMQNHLRGGKVLVGWSQNDPHKTTVCVYFLRAKHQPTNFHLQSLGMKLPRRQKKKNSRLLKFEAKDVLKRFKSSMICSRQF